MALGIVAPAELPIARIVVSLVIRSSMVITTVITTPAIVNRGDPAKLWHNETVKLSGCSSSESRRAISRRTQSIATVRAGSLPK